MHATDAPPPAPDAPPPPSRKNRDRQVKLGFAVLIVVVVAVLAIRQYLGVAPPGEWGSDVPAAVAQAAAEDRHVLALFHSRPPGDAYTHVLDMVLRKSHNRKRIAEANLILVRSADEALAAQYGAAELPALVLIDPAGEAVAVETGRVAETALMEMLDKRNLD